MSATAEAAATVVDVLPEAHGLLHSWNCQVLFSPLWTDGAAAGSGEDAELFFSFLSPAAATTRHMGETPLEKVCVELLGTPSANSAATITSLIAQIKELARSELQRSRQAVSVAMEFFMLHTIAASLVADLDSLKSNRDVLRGKLIATLGASSSIAADRLHEATINDVAEEYFVEHQNKLEALVVQRQKHWNRLQLFARTSKEKTKFKGKLRADDKQPKDAVILYNNLIPFGRTPRLNALTVEELTRHPPDFPWTLEATRGLDERTLLHRYGTYASMRLCEAFLKVQRLEEEMVLLSKESHQFLLFCEALFAQQCEAMLDVKCDRSLVETFAPEARSGRYFSEDAFTAETSSQDERLRSGVFAVVARAQAEVETLLKKARKVLGAAAVPTTMAEPAAPEESAAMEGADGEPAAASEPAAVHMDSGAGGLAAVEVATASDEGSNWSYSDEDHFVGSPFDSDVADEVD
ncbi:g5330 [Coccomyxa elongata]